MVYALTFTVWHTGASAFYFGVRLRGSPRLRMVRLVRR